MKRPRSLSLSLPPSFFSTELRTRTAFATWPYMYAKSRWKRFSTRARLAQYPNIFGTSMNIGSYFKIRKTEYCAGPFSDIWLIMQHY